MHLAARLIAAGLVAAALWAPTPAFAQASETAVKAAFLPRFARYVTWPPSSRPGAGQPFVLCLIGGDPFGRVLDQAVRSQSVDGHRVVVRRHASAPGPGACHLAFLESSRTQPAGQVIAALGRTPVLTITDAANGSQRGIIHFAVVSGRVRFFIDEAEASRRGLTISSRLMALAVGVKQK